MELPIYKLRVKDSKGNVVGQQAIDMEDFAPICDKMQ